MFIKQMSFFKLFKKYPGIHPRKENSCEMSEKLNVTNVFNKSEEVHTSTSNKNLEYNSSQRRKEHYQLILNSSIVNLQKLKQLAWDGAPQNNRSQVWKLLLKYMPTNKENQVPTLERKRKEYFVMVNTYIENPSLEQDAQQKKIFKLINDDVMRTLPQSNLFRNEKIQKMMRRLLYVWHMRHPASGYVQGINDVVTPFIIVFISEYVEVNLDTLDVPAKLDEMSAEDLSKVEGDAYYCVSKILDGILDNYTSSWPGIQKSFSKIAEVVKRIDPQLITHFQNQQIDFYHMYFKWVTCLLLRQFTIKICLRLYDTYISSQNGYFGLCLFIFASIVLKYSKKFKKMGFEEMMIFQQNMPTKQWSEQDLATIIAEAYVYQSYFIK